MDLQEIRSDLNTLDSMAGVVYEFIEDNADDSMRPLTEEESELTGLCTQLQNAITNVQEQQKWI
jgi:hypothetical protein